LVVIITARVGLASLAVGLAEELTAQGYRAACIDKHLRVLRHLDLWMAAEGLGLGELTDSQVERFLGSRHSAGTRWPSRRGMGPLLAYLRASGVVPTAPDRVPMEPIDRVLDTYERYLARERALAASTIENYRRYAEVFFAGLDEPVLTGLTRLSAAEVTAAVRRQCRTRSVGWTKNFTTALRSLMRYLFFEGSVPRDLSTSVLSVAGWRQGGLPKALRREDIVRLLASCAGQQHAARRDLAILTLLARLGLRAGEVAALELQDIDWRAGELVVRGKADRQDRLPLPHDVGKAIADYLVNERPETASRTVFITAVAPRTGISTKTVAGVTRCACERCGIVPVGPHRLRHAAATEMLRGGASLAEIGQVLGHQHQQTTAIYAKVDLTALSRLAMPWPVVSV
jgi:site-specific recombinase XerD